MLRSIHLQHAMATLHATLHRLEIFTPDPPALADYYARAFGLRATGDDDALTCSAAGRQLRLLRGPAGQLRSAEFCCASGADLDALRQRLRERALPLEEDASEAIGVADPEGRLIRFCLPPATGSTEAAIGQADLGARLQHFAVRTPEPEALLVFYTEQLGFVLSDRVEDPAGRLTAAFLRSDEEHHALAIFRAAEPRFDHFSCEADDWTALRDWADHMAGAGIELAWGVGRHGPGNDTFFMVRDPDGNMAEISAELEVCAPDRPTGVWPHRPSTLNRWGVAIMRS